MNKIFSILHISDLHKGEGNNFDDLYASLCADCENYEGNIEKPSIIVVSGDLAEGADTEETIKEQYCEVEEFLNKLVKYFLKGDKRRIIIVPGNHDLCRAITRDSMTPIPIEHRDETYKKYKNGAPTIRWNWDDYLFYNITQKEKYASRFKYFVDFYNRFYSGLNVIDDCDNMNNIVDLPEFNLSFVTFNSCYGIDHLCQIGQIHSCALSNVQQDLSKRKKMGRLILGVWHHNISGIPQQNNYINPKILRSMMDFGIRIGLYGHQHHCEIINDYKDVFFNGEMLLVSAGCLYGMSKELPEGTSRQYNIIEVDMHGEQASIKIYIREDKIHFDIPSWGACKVGDDNFYETIITLPPINIEHVLNDIKERTETTKNYLSGCKELLLYRDKSDLVDRYLDEFLTKFTSDKEICQLYFEPHTEAQAISLLGAYINECEKESIRKILACEIVCNSKTPMLLELITQSKKIK